MDEIKFSPDSSLVVHEEGALKLICAHFRSHEDGLPEWVKNSSDMYVRIDSATEESVILLMFRDGGRRGLATVGCLDFGGMTTEDIEKKFRHWADPFASGGDSQANVEGGHGNGGKCYMAQLFESHSYIHSIRDGRGHKYGFKEGGFTPGYFPSREQGRGYRVENPDEELEKALSDFDLSLDGLPPAVKAAWAKRKCFTLVVGFKARHLNRERIPYRKWIDNLRGHQQMVQSLQRNRIFAFHNGVLLPDAAPLKLTDIIPIPGAEAPRIVEIPSELLDPVNEEMVDITTIKGISRLELRTSNVSMRWTLKARHTINGWTHGGRSTGSWQMSDLSSSGYSAQIYGDIYLDELSGYTQNDRRNHSDAPVTRAIKQWLKEQIESYSNEFVRMDRLQATQEEKTELSRLNEVLNDWKNKFLEHEFGGIGQEATGGTGGKPKPKLPRGEPARLLLTFTHHHAGQGVTFRPSLDFLDANGNRIRPVPYVWESSDWAVATVDGELNMITTHMPGKTSITAVCKDSGVRSNSVELEVLDIAAINLSPAEIEVRSGGRLPLVANVTTVDNRELEGIYLVWIEGNGEVVSVGSGGMVFGLTPGTTTVQAADNKVTSSAVMVTVTKPDEKGKDGGSGFPRILLSEIDNDPLGETPPVFSSSEPPVHQRVQDVDHNIWWINMASPLAKRYLDAARGSSSRSREWRVYHLERYIEIMVKIILNYSFLHGDDVTYETMMRRWEEESTSMQLRAHESLQVFLDGGDVIGEQGQGAVA